MGGTAWLPVPSESPHNTGMPHLTSKKPPCRPSHIACMTYLRHPLRAHEAARFDNVHPSFRESVHELRLDCRGYHCRLILQPIPRPNFDDANAFAFAHGGSSRVRARANRETTSALKHRASRRREHGGQSQAIGRACPVAYIGPSEGSTKSVMGTMIKGGTMARGAAAADTRASAPFSATCASLCLSLVSCLHHPCPRHYPQSPAMALKDLYRQNCSKIRRIA